MRVIYHERVKNVGVCDDFFIYCNVSYRSFSYNPQL